MNRERLRNQLAVGTDRWTGRPTDTAQQLLELADHIRVLLLPVEADANYRRRLKGELLLAAQRRQDNPKMSLFQQHRKGILIGAAAVGSVASLLGVIIAFVVRYRHGRASHLAG